MRRPVADTAAQTRRHRNVRYAGRGRRRPDRNVWLDRSLMRLYDDGAAVFAKGDMR